MAVRVKFLDEDSEGRILGVRMDVEDAAGIVLRSETLPFDEPAPPMFSDIMLQTRRHLLATTGLVVGADTFTLDDGGRGLSARIAR